MKETEIEMSLSPQRSEQPSTLVVFDACSSNSSRRRWAKGKEASGQQKNEDEDKCTIRRTRLPLEAEAAEELERVTVTGGSDSSSEMEAETASDGGCRQE